MVNSPGINQNFGLQKYESLFNLKNYQQKSNIFRLESPDTVKKPSLADLLLAGSLLSYIFDQEITTTL
jgi:hypothetical protein